MLCYRDGDAGAFDALYARHKGGLYRYLLRQCREPAAAEELFQDVWMNLIRARARYTVQAKFTTYLYRLAHNRLIDHYRKHEPGHGDLVRRGGRSRVEDLVDERAAAARDGLRRPAPGRGAARAGRASCRPRSARPSCCSRKAA